jgi:hypothetical protein
MTYTMWAVTNDRVQMAKSALVNVSTMTDEMYHELMLFLIRCIDNSITPYPEPVESSQLPCESLGRKIFEVLR